MNSPLLNVLRLIRPWLDVSALCLAIVLLAFSTPCLAGEKAPGQNGQNGQSVEASPETLAQKEQLSRQEETLSMLQVLLDSMARKTQTLRTLELQQRRAPDEDRRNELQVQIREVQREIEQQKETFKNLAGGGRLEDLEEAEGDDFTWDQQLKTILSPVLREMQSLTERPRQIDSLRTEIENITSALPLLEKALERIDRLIAETSDIKLRRELQDIRATWVERKADLENDLQVARYRLEQVLSNQRPLSQSVRDIFEGFFKTRGKHLLFALLTFLLVFTLLRWCKGLIFNLPKLKEIEKKNFLVRLINVTFIFVVILTASVSALAVFYAAGDWLLLVISFIMIFSIAWSAKAGLMQYWEEIKLILNVGSVREGERIIYRGVPWLVERLHYYTRLTNPELSGGHLRVRLNQFIEMSSRPFGPDEPWFPCRRGDWVLLADETYGKVVQQNPDMVRLMLFGGSFKTYPTTSFLEQNPVVLSTGFLVRSVFGVDYSHQKIATTTILEAFRRNMEKALEEADMAKHTASITVDFHQAGSSSLDVIFFGYFHGAIADRYFSISRMFQRVCVDTCTQQGWTIPFPQLTLHKAEAAPAKTAREITE